MCTLIWCMHNMVCQIRFCIRGVPTKSWFVYGIVNFAEGFFLTVTMTSGKPLTNSIGFSNSSQMFDLTVVHMVITESLKMILTVN